MTKPTAEDLRKQAIRKIVYGVQFPSSDGLTDLTAAHALLQLPVEAIDAVLAEENLGSETSPEK